MKLKKKLWEIYFIELFSETSEPYENKHKTQLERFTICLLLCRSKNLRWPLRQDIGPYGKMGGKNSPAIFFLLNSNGT